MGLYRLTPALKEAIWGGRRLFSYGKGEGAELSNVAESWELSFVGGSESRIDGTAVTELFKKEELYAPDFPFDAFPVLTKFIDARDNLSVQVHPSDEYALRNEGQFGKTEMWYVVDADEGTGLYVGFDKAYTKDEIRAGVADGSIENMLSFKRVKKGDCFFIPAGTVHAIGGGVLIFEIQQSSTLTYRLYDYKRRDKDGKERELHIDKSLAVLSPLPYSHAAPTDTARGCRLLASCKYFTVREYTVSGDTEIPLSPRSFLSLTVVKGHATLTLGEDAYDAAAGDTYLCKKSSGKLVAKGDGVLITVGLE